MQSTCLGEWTSHSTKALLQCLWVADTGPGRSSTLWWEECHCDAERLTRFLQSATRI
ncbi:hypothetical protein COCMIDRAFT_87522 [Bipolaris oryzae ATCC 44560]|uniref:Uncharacterized protein n=1 Tax=Bipolaris oryzae ATCC 44560 TaxID=930090 RepID=W6ZE82_COCMI|nr:uncharacterized protein COCMIDRAFT_87522 [Bipolaris oryzae ATCC 44560]EUC48315.1 hypothetical protein COCMIDRAFT_87522 [Bipolaris oryzae ATCC 44560]